jgi:Putative zinc-finger
MKWVQECFSTQKNFSSGTLRATFTVHANQIDCHRVAFTNACGCEKDAMNREILVTCAEVRRELSNYIDDEITLELRARIEEHVSACSGCKALYDGVRNVVMLVSSTELIELPRGFSARLYRRLANCPL